jgi:hypothetical protein
VRRSKIREIKQAKELLEERLIGIDEQIEHLIVEENNNTNSKVKKFDLKLFLENFTNDQKDAEIKTNVLQKEQEETKKRVELQIKKDENRKKKQQEILAKQKEEKETLDRELYLKKLEMMRQRSRDKHEEVEKAREEWKSKIIVEKNYKYVTAEEEFKKKQEQIEEDRKNQYLTEIMKKRTTLLKPIKKGELDEFSKRVMEERQKKLYEKEKERLLKQEEIISLNVNLPKPETNTYKQILEEEKKFKNLKEKEKIDKLYTHLKVKNFSKEVKDTLLPEIDEQKRREREERIEKLLNNKVKKHQRKRGGRVLLVKAINPKTSLSVDASRDSKQESNRSDMSKYNYNELKERLYKSRSLEKRKPMDKAPDYLTEMRRQKENNNNNNETNNKQYEKPSNYYLNIETESKWEKMIKNKNNTLLDNVENIKIKVHILEEQAKMKEKYLKHGGTEKNPEIVEDVSNMMIDAIKAKLTILENLTKKDI